MTIPQVVRVWRFFVGGKKEILNVYVAFRLGHSIDVAIGRLSIQDNIQWNKGNRPRLIPVRCSKLL